MNKQSTRNERITVDNRKTWLFPKKSHKKRIIPSFFYYKVIFLFTRSPCAHNFHDLFFFLQSPKPVCMFYFSHPFGISTPSSANNVGSTKAQKKGSKYTTTTYLVTEIQKNLSEESQDEVEIKKHPYTERELIPWPRNFLLPPLIQLLEKKHGKWLVFIYP